MQNRFFKKMTGFVLGSIGAASMWALLYHFFGHFIGLVFVSMMFGFFVNGVVEAIFEENRNKKNVVGTHT